MRNHQRSSREKTGTGQNTEAAKGRLSDLTKPRKDYLVYHLSGQELVKYIAMYAVLDGVISYLFFSSWIAFVILLPGAPLFLKDRKNVLQKKREKEMKRQFIDALQMMSASLQAGYSVENALQEAQKELAKVYERDAIIVQEFRLMSAQLAMNRNLEELFLDFGRRSGIEDIQSFAEVFLTAKRSGGDLMAIIRNTTSCIQQKEETLQEIETCLAGKAMEQNIMSVIPVGILAYVRLSAPEFVSALYGNLTGTTVMIICFIVYVVAYFWGRKIVQIEV
jgi:tight adherence protein B